MDQNDLTGAIPATIGNLTNLVYLDLSRNQLSGPIPWTIKRLDDLEDLLLGENNLSCVDIPRQRIRKNSRFWNLLEEAFTRVENSDSEDSDSEGSWVGSDSDDDDDDNNNIDNV
ncbi:hypothetical protein BDR26DRAFT_887144, partial [Obelidium mucronatum]